LPANLASEEARTPKTAMPKNAAAPFVLSEALLSAFDTKDRINQYLLAFVRMWPASSVI